jgi:hypothetical protein
MRHPAAETTTSGLTQRAICGMSGKSGCHAELPGTNVLTIARDLL